MVSVTEILAILESKVAPVALSRAYCEKFGAYDNSGILLDCGKAVTGILFSLDFSAAALSVAKQKGYNLIVTHHPAIYSPVRKIEGTLLDAAMSGISVISMHLNFDMATMGIDERLMLGLGGKHPVAVLETVGENAYGRVYDVPVTTLESLQKRIEGEFRTQRTVFYGEKNKRICRIASFCGAGADEKAVAFAAENGADVLVSADFKHHIIAMAIERGLSVAQMTHYASESYGFIGIYKNILADLPVPTDYFEDGSLL